MSEKKDPLKDRISTLIAEWGGTWSFILWFLSLSSIYMLINIFSYKKFDPYPFQFLNLALGFIASLQAPFIMMVQNRREKIESEKQQKDLDLDLSTNILVKAIFKEMRRKKNE